MFCMSFVLQTIITVPIKTNYKRSCFRCCCVFSFHIIGQTETETQWGETSQDDASAIDTVNHLKLSQCVPQGSLQILFQLSQLSSLTQQQVISTISLLQQSRLISERTSSPTCHPLVVSITSGAGIGSKAGKIYLQS